MSQKRKTQIRTLLKGIETGDAASVAVVNPEKYIQHNPQTREGGEGLAALFKRLAKSSPRVNIVRIFSDGDYIFGQTEYDFATSRVGFEIFRFEGELAVEHWDNIQPRRGPNRFGHSMVSGPTDATDLSKTQENRELARAFVGDVLINGQFDKLARYIDERNYTEHHPDIGDELSTRYRTSEDSKLKYDQIHRVLAEGSFVLIVSEGSMNGVHSSFFDLFRLADGKLVEHWDTIEAVPDRSEWKNENGKF